eukprot:gnl/TRDRNA2_/TRDRNA2_88441_c0_seq1.p1 gnl/TRDRNA2_/TRDRNA2_88441_c0~~gnl/TRDRNA2_/TRDRNA2_88441_c0_seq1.p1  ORF type:complete len:263 (+),score=23.91 gnl/TRDRNA2_/TRDRNA2_88441_c0_seq1:320-1108(+)
MARFRSMSHTHAIWDDGNVRYTYTLVTVADVTGSFQVLSSPPWALDVSRMDFPLVLRQLQGNAISVANLIEDNIVAQAMNPFWTLLSFFSLWGWFGLAVLAPAGHVLQLCSMCTIVYSAAWALQHPPDACPPFVERQQHIYDGCQCRSGTTGLTIYLCIVFFQSILALQLISAAELVRRPFLPLVEFSRTFNGIKVVQPSMDGDDTLCPICLEMLSVDETNPQDLGDLWILPCSHVYHGSCVVKWLVKPGVALGTCPTCRAK